MTTIDFGKALQDARGASFEALPSGDYDVEVEKAEAVMSQNGKPMIKATMRVTSGPYEKRPIINRFTLSLENPTATAIFFRHMKCFGLDETFFSRLGTGTLDPVANALIGRRARLTLGQREWQGEMRNEVTGVKPFTGAPPMAAPPAGPSAGPATGGMIPGPTPPQMAPAPAPVQAPTPPPAPAASIPQPPAPPAAPAPVATAVPTTTAPAPSNGVPVAPSPAPATYDAAAAPQPPAAPGGVDDLPF